MGSISPAELNGGTDYSPRIDHREPVKPTGVLNDFKQFDTTPVIGTEFPTANLADWMDAPNSDELLRELALTVSRRGVVFFRAQDDMTNERQKELASRLGLLSGKPPTSHLHIHPINNSRRGTGVDDHITAIGDQQAKEYKGVGSTFSDNFDGSRQTARLEWHSDIMWERVPCDYAILRMVKFPPSGGDTLWASGYELYDRISPPYRKFLESLTVTCGQKKFAEVAKRAGFDLFAGPRGAPENVGTDLRNVHPLVRTNPVTGWKSIFAVGVHVEQVNGLSELESEHLKDVFLRLIMENHDLQVRHRWVNPNDIAIWDNRSVFHAATLDHQGGRSGFRATGLGERPYFDPESSSRRQALREAGETR
ncbi:taurine catabolism dioxygenase [Aspergillus avenaceus]|uniref:Taurine catabolism dioxygenase n=1 Tax=Aspergillus avenaceus TaxID=36643 RepID=A0A5N6U5B7_ASPAV|nr:taurine catabolism dioxygenase [Aspergillus avenaceus]